MVENDLPIVGSNFGENFHANAIPTSCVTVQERRPNSPLQTGTFEILAISVVELIAEPRGYSF